MAFAFRLGPVPSADDSTYLYVAIDDSGTPESAQAGDDVAGLRELIGRIEGTLVVEPGLAKAGKRLGLRRRALPPAIAHAKATMALVLSTTGTYDPAVAPQLLGELLDASVAFMKAKPWRWVDGDTALEIAVVHDGERRPLEGSIMGQAAIECGLMLCFEPGMLRRVLEAESQRDAEALSEAMDMLSVSMEREPDWAARTIKAVLGPRIVPTPMRVVNRQPQAASALELATLTAALRAASELSRGRTEARGRSVVGPPVEVVVRVPADTATSHASPSKKVGRNQPCPCGSGKKYKRCCLPERQAREAGRHVEPAANRSLDEALVAKILEFANDQRLGKADELPPAWHALGALPRGTQLLVPLLAFHCPEASGQTALELYLEAHDESLAPDARDLLTAQQSTLLSVWEVLHVEPGVGMEVVDLLTGERRTIREISGSKTLAFRDAVLARVLTVAGISTFAGLHPWPLPPAAAHEVVTAIREQIKLKVKPVPPERLAAPVVVDALLEQWHAAKARHTDEEAIVEREVHNTDAEPFAEHEDRFTIKSKRWRDMAEAIMTLPGTYLDGLTHKKAEITFTQPGNAIHSHWTNTVIGTAVVERQGLTLRTNSRARIDRLRALLEHELGQQLTHRGRKASAPRTVRTRSRGPLALDATQLGPLFGDSQAMLLREQARHMVETKNDMLDGKTPRQAMRSAHGRRMLHQMLKSHEHRPAPKMEGYVAYIREILGMSVTGECVHRTAGEHLNSSRKASETLLDFATPLLLELGDEALVEPLLEIAALVWNAHVLVRAKRLPPLPASLTSDPRVVLLKDRRRRFFGNDQRLFEVLSVRWRHGELNVRVATRSYEIEPPGKPEPRAAKKSAVKQKRAEQLDLL